MNFFAVWRSAVSPSETMQALNVTPVSEGHTAEGYPAKKFISSLPARRFPSALRRSPATHFVAVCCAANSFRRRNLSASVLS